MIIGGLQAQTATLPEFKDRRGFILDHPVEDRS
jgi:hypothetical protein